MPLDIIVLQFGNNIVAPNIPDQFPLERLCHAPEHRQNNDIQDFGLFDSSTPNYATYYPDVKAEDLQPKDADFITPMFRALSEVIVHKGYNPTDFGEGNVLKRSMNLLLGQSIYVDHERLTGNALGAVSKVMWDEAYTAKGVKIPAGINALLKIDGKSNPRLARGILMDPPSVHSTSVTVEFQWEKSHSLSDDEFFRKMGTLDDKGKMYRKIATDIKRYHEISLVSHGADPFAQKVNEKGEINNPTFAQKTYYTKLSDDSLKKANQVYYFFNCKNEFLENSEDKTIPPDSNKDKDTKNKSMKELQTFLTSLALILAMPPKNEGEEYASDELTAKVAELIAAKKKAETEKTALEQSVNSLTEIKTKYEELEKVSGEAIELKAFKTEKLKELRDKTIANYKLISAGKEDAKILALLGNEKTGFELLTIMNEQYETQLDEKIPLACDKCGSKSVSRKSSTKEKVDNNEGEVKHKKKSKSFNLYAQTADEDSK